MGSGAHYFGVAQGYADGREAERGAIIKWLRSEAGARAVDQGYKSVAIAENIAAKLEAGKHR